MCYVIATGRYSMRALLPLATFALFWGLYVMFGVRLMLHPIPAILSVVAGLVAILNMHETYGLRTRSPLAESSSDRVLSDWVNVICLMIFMAFWGTAAACMWMWLTSSEAPQDWQVITLWLLIGAIAGLPVVSYLVWARKVKPWRM